MTTKEVTRVGMPPMRYPLTPERLANLRLAQRGVALCEQDSTRGARLLVRVFRTLITLIFDLESTELRLEIMTRENLRLRERVRALEGELNDQEKTVLQSEWDEQPTRVGRDSERLANAQRKS